MRSLQSKEKSPSQQPRSFRLSRAASGCGSRKGNNSGRCSSSNWPLSLGPPDCVASREYASNVFFFSKPPLPTTTAGKLVRVFVAGPTTNHRIMHGWLQRRAKTRWIEISEAKTEELCKFYYTKGIKLIHGGSFEPQVEKKTLKKWEAGLRRTH